ncbi:transposase [Azospirillum sp. A26]|uniref:transposase n=1 Tax=Azospirillum sp. A26 TaxID=3160607 RepID=UPI003673627F
MIQGSDWLKEAGCGWCLLPIGSCALRGWGFLGDPLGCPCTSARRPEPGQARWQCPLASDRRASGISSSYVERFLGPTLSHGDVAVVDNLPAHKLPAVRAAIERTGAVLELLPPYSPDFTTIEMAFSKIKANLRKAAARTLPEPWEAIRDAIDNVTPTDSRAFFIAAPATNQNDPNPL